MVADKKDMTRRAIWGRAALAWTTGMALAAQAQVMTAPAVTAPVQAPALRPSAVVTAPYMVAVSYPAPGQNPPTAAATFPAGALSYSTSSPPLALPAGAGTKANFVDVTTAASRGVPLPVIPARTPLTSLTITAYKAGVVVALMSFTQPVLVSTSYSSAAAGVPEETLRFTYTQVTTTYAH
jgi:hypothetical protein